MQAMHRTLEDMESCKAELQLPQGAEENLLVFSRAGQLLKDLDELEHQTAQQAKLLEVGQSYRSRKNTIIFLKMTLAKPFLCTGQYK